MDPPSSALAGVAGRVRALGRLGDQRGERRHAPVGPVDRVPVRVHHLGFGCTGVSEIEAPSLSVEQLSKASIKRMDSTVGAKRQS